VAVPVSGRFGLVSYLPTYAVLWFVLVLVWAGAPGSHVRFKAAWHTASNLGAGPLVLVVVAVGLVALLLHPLQLPLVRLLEGGWPAWLGSGRARRRQLRRKGRLREAAGKLPQPPAVATEGEVCEAGIAGTLLRARYPLPDHLVRPTALGNALAAMEDTAGRPYGLDAVVAWPRLYPLLGDRAKAIVDDRRDTMDGLARMSASAAFAAVAAAGLLWRAGWWELLVLVPVLVAALAYHGAVTAARAYGEAVHLCFDLHRFDLYRAQHLELPRDIDGERRLGAALSDLWRQGVPLELTYRDEGATP
jgi:hypothetical protein